MASWRVTARSSRVCSGSDTVPWCGGGWDGQVWGGGRQKMGGFRSQPCPAVHSSTNVSQGVTQLSYTRKILLRLVLILCVRDRPGAKHAFLTLRKFMTFFRVMSRCDVNRVFITKPQDVVCSPFSAGAFLTVLVFVHEERIHSPGTETHSEPHMTFALLSHKSALQNLVPCLQSKFLSRPQADIQIHTHTNSHTMPTF